MEAIYPSNQNQTNPLLKQKSEIKKVISQKCTRHPLNNADLLHLKSDIKIARICISCVQQDKIPFNNYLQIKDVLQGSWDSDLFTYPVLNDPQLQLRQAIKSNSDTLDSDKQQIDTFFAELTKCIDDQIEKKKLSVKLKIIEFEAIQQRYLATYQQIEDIDNLKQILQQDNNEAQLVKFINNHMKNSENNTLRMKQINDEFQVMKNQFSTEQPNKTKDIINSLLKELNFFDKSPPRYTDEKNQLRNELLNKQLQADQLQLQLNGCKTQITIDQKTLQDQISLIRELKDQNGSLSQQISDMIEELKTKLQRKQQEVDQLQQYLSACKKQIQEQQLIIEKLQGQNNYLSQQISDQRQEINSCLTLVTKKEQNQISNDLRKQLRSYEQSAHALYSQKQSIQQIELQPFKSTDLLQETNLILGNSYDSKKLSVLKNYNQQLEFSNDTRRSCCGLSYMDFILNPSTNYVVHVELQQNEGKKKYFVFGIIPNSQKDTTEDPSGCLCYSEYEDRGQLNTLLKGQDIRNDNQSLESRSLEMRINIERQIFKVGSLPNYESVVRIDNPRQIEPATPYRFYFWGLNEQTKMTITKLETVSEFNDLM